MKTTHAVEPKAEIFAANIRWIGETLFPKSGKGYGQKLALLCGVSRTTIHQWLNGRIPSPARLASLAELVSKEPTLNRGGTTPSDLVTRRLENAQPYSLSANVGERTAERPAHYRSSQSAGGRS